jgi:hypothetical protein
MVLRDIAVIDSGLRVGSRIPDSKTESGVPAVATTKQTEEQG